MNWYIGQRIVAVKDHSRGVFKKGDEFVIKGLRESPCCKHVQIDIGIPSVSGNGACFFCKRRYNSPYIWWFHNSLFRPIDELSDYTIESIIEEIDTVEKIKTYLKEVSPLST